MGANQTGVASKCNRCGLCHFGQCPPKCNNCGKMGHKDKDCRSKNVVSGTNTRSAVVCYECGERGHKSYACPKKADRQGGNVRADKSFVDVRFSHYLDIIPAKLNTRSKSKLADGKSVGYFDVIIGMIGCSRLKEISASKQKIHRKRIPVGFVSSSTEKEPQRKHCKTCQ
ncbi:putative reverse transcriptase domain-containing protein [Tanacetum coccineum]